MSIRFLPEQPVMRPRLLDVIKRIPALLREVHRARQERISAQAALSKIRQRQMERYQNGFTSLAINIRNTTGNHGRLQPRR